ncbi:MAG TPA: PH domain-containing protein [Clostridia bacterium]|nr:PH domain-containing protein [Clostridia bacterium]
MKEYRYDWFSYIIPILLIFSTFNMPSDLGHFFPILLVIIAIAALLLIINMLVTRIYITGEGITKRTLLGVKSIPWDSIIRIDRVRGRNNATAGVKVKAQGITIRLDIGMRNFPELIEEIIEHRADVYFGPSVKFLKRIIIFTKVFLTLLIVFVVFFYTFCSFKASNALKMEDYYHNKYEQLNRMAGSAQNDD